MVCPVCGEALREMERSGVTVDLCPRCKGVWLDRGELEKILDREVRELSAGPSVSPYVAAPGERFGDDPRHHDDDRRQDRDHHGHEPGHGGAPGRPQRRRGWLGEILGSMGGDD